MKKKDRYYITLFISITILYGIDNISQNILHIKSKWENIQNIPWNIFSPIEHCYESD
jgi:hypothetical protein